jgi:two-component system NtrC family sensor kinase
MLDLGRLEGGFDTRRETVSVGSILKYTLDIYGDRAQEKGVVLASNSPADLPMVRANPIRIRQLLDNLVGNAIKYTPAGGKVSVGIEAQDNQIILEVRDTGPGIPQDEHNRIFEKFYRASNAPEGVSGTGLGLAIVKSIVESYQGRIWVESAPGQGSSFFVVLHAVETGS